MKSRSDSPESLVALTVDDQRKRTAHCVGIESKRKKPAPEDSDDESSEQFSGSSPQKNIQISTGGSLQNPLIFASNISHKDPPMLPEESWSSFQNPTISASNIPQNDPQLLLSGSESFQNSLIPTSNITFNESQNLPGDSERNYQNFSVPQKDLPSGSSQLILNNKVIFPESLSGSLNQFGFPCVSKQNLVCRSPSTSAINPSNAFISFGNHPNIVSITYGNTGSLVQNQQYLFRNLLHKSDYEVEDLSFRLRMFQPDLDCGELSEDKRILGDLRTILEREGKLEGSTSQMETCSKHKTVYQNDHDWDKILQKREDIPISDSIEAQIISNPKETSVRSISKDERKRKKSPNNSLEEDTKRLCTKLSEELSIVDSSSSIAEQGSKPKIDLPSFEKEMDTIVIPVSSGISEFNVSSRLEKFIKNNKIKFLDDDPMPPFHEFISHDLSDLASWAEDFDEIQQDESFKDVTGVEENASSGTNNSDKIEELTSIETVVSVFADVKIIS